MCEVSYILGGVNLKCCSFVLICMKSKALSLSLFFFYTMLSDTEAHSGRGIPLLCRISAEINGMNIARSSGYLSTIPTVLNNRRRGVLYIRSMDGHSNRRGVFNAVPELQRAHTTRIISSGSKWTGLILAHQYTTTAKCM